MNEKSIYSLIISLEVVPIADFESGRLWVIVVNVWIISFELFLWYL
jgi:hypothetical protein